MLLLLPSAADDDDDDAHIKMPDKKTLSDISLRQFLTEIKQYYYS